MVPTCNMTSESVKWNVLYLCMNLLKKHQWLSVNCLTIYHPLAGNFKMGPMPNKKISKNSGASVSL